VFLPAILRRSTFYFTLLKSASDFDFPLKSCEGFPNSVLKAQKCNKNGKRQVRFKCPWISKDIIQGLRHLDSEWYFQAWTRPRRSGTSTAAARASPRALGRPEGKGQGHKVIDLRTSRLSRTGRHAAPFLEPVLTAESDFISPVAF
jgi:hypothetical protein